MNFKQRSYQKELLDGDGIAFKDIKRNMQELNTINHYLGGHKITLSGIKKLIRSADKNSIIKIVEIGCGGGDNLRVIKHWAEQNNQRVKLVGIDINEECVAFAKEQKKNKDIHFICSDYRLVAFSQKPHIIFNSLFCHHFSDEELVTMLQWMQQRSSVGFFINDLHRHLVAYYSIKWITKAFSKNYLVKNDAPLSVLRGFTKKEWMYIFEKANINISSCSWRWAFRWLVIYHAGTEK